MDCIRGPVLVALGVLFVFYYYNVLLTISATTKPKASSPPSPGSPRTSPLLPTPAGRPRASTQNACRAIIEVWAVVQGSDPDV